MEGETLGNMDEIIGRGNPSRQGGGRWKGRPKETWRRSLEGETQGNMKKIVRPLTVRERRGDPRRHGGNRWTSDGKRAKGRPTETWRISLEGETQGDMEEIVGWGETQRDRDLPLTQ